MIGNARFSTHSQPVGFALESGSTRVAPCCQIRFRAGADLRASGLCAGVSIGIRFELLKLTFDLRHVAGCGEDFTVGFRFPRSAAIASHSDCSWTEVLSRWAINPLNFQRVAGYVFRQSSFSQGAIATHLPHFANPLDFDGAKFAIIETANFRF